MNVFDLNLSLFSSHLLQQQDNQILQVCLDALHNILKQTKDEHLEAVVTQIEECGGKQIELIPSFYSFIQVWIRLKISKDIQIWISIINHTKFSRNSSPIQL